MTTSLAAKNSLFSWEKVWLALLGIVSIGTQVYIALTPTTSLLRWFHIDDAFYYYQVAANVAQGTGVTFDGLSHTNGFHPLWLLLNVPVFALKGVDPLLPLRIVVVMEGFLNVAAGILLFRGARRFFAPWVAALMATVWMFAPTIFAQVMVGGLETSLNAAFLAWFWERMTFFQATHRWSQLTKRGWLLGVVSGLTILSRLDSVFVVGVFWLWLAWKIGSAYGWHRWQDWMRVLARAAAPAIALVGGYLLWSQWYVGNWYPVSAAVKHWWGVKGDTVYGPPRQPRWIDSVRWVRTKPFWWLNGWLEHSQHWLAAFLGAAADRLRWALVLWAFLLALGGKALKDNILRALIGLWLGAALLHAVYYEVVPYTGERPWYWVQETMGGVLLMGALMDAGWRRGVRERDFPRAAFIIGSVIVLAGGLGHIKNVLRSYPLHPDDREHIYFSSTRWLEEHTKPGTLIGMTGAGSTGYFIHDRTIEPLDGLINGYAYFEALKTGRAAEYLSAIGLDYVFAKDFVQTGEPYAKAFKGRLQPVADYLYSPNGEPTHLWRFLPVVP